MSYSLELKNPTIDLFNYIDSQSSIDDLPGRIVSNNKKIILGESHHQLYKKFGGFFAQIDDFEPEMFSVITSIIENEFNENKKTYNESIKMFFISKVFKKLSDNLIREYEEDVPERRDEKQIEKTRDVGKRLSTLSHKIFHTISCDENDVSISKLLTLCAPIQISEQEIWNEFLNKNIMKHVGRTLTKFDSNEIVKVLKSNDVIKKLVLQNNDLKDLDEDQINDICLLYIAKVSKIPLTWLSQKNIIYQKQFLEMVRSLTEKKQLPEELQFSWAINRKELKSFAQIMPDTSFRDTDLKADILSLLDLLKTYDSKAFKEISEMTVTYDEEIEGVTKTVTYTTEDLLKKFAQVCMDKEARVGTPRSEDKQLLENFYEMITCSLGHAIDVLKKDFESFSEENKSDRIKMKQKHLTLQLIELIKLIADGAPDCGGRYLAIANTAFRKICRNQETTFKTVSNEILAEYRALIFDEIVDKILGENGTLDAHDYNMAMQTLGIMLGIPGAATYQIVSDEMARKDFNAKTATEFLDEFYSQYTPENIQEWIFEKIKNNDDYRKLYFDACKEIPEDWKQQQKDECLQDFQETVKENKELGLEISQEEPNESDIESLLVSKFNNLYIQDEDTGDFNRETIGILLRQNVDHLNYIN